MQKREVITLASDKGYKLTLSTDIPLETRVITDVVVLGVNDSEGNWKEITDEEAEKLQEEINKAINN